jgi:hypothetical protein
VGKAKGAWGFKTIPMRPRLLDAGHSAIEIAEIRVAHDHYSNVQAPAQLPS